jgi:hypothetical protein
VDAKIATLKKLIETHRKAVLARFDQDAKKSIAELVQAFWRDIVRNPPSGLTDQGITEPTTEQAKEYLRRKLTDTFPNAHDLAEDMRVTRVVKDITWSTLNEKGFVEWLRKQWPERTDLGLPFEQYRAARERMSASTRTAVT